MVRTGGVAGGTGAAAGFARGGAFGECLVCLAGVSAVLTAGLIALPAFPIVVHASALGAGAAIGAGGNGTETPGKGTATFALPFSGNCEGDAPTGSENSSPPTGVSSETGSIAVVGDAPSLIHGLPPLTRS